MRYYYYFLSMIIVLSLSCGECKKKNFYLPPKGETISLPAVNQPEVNTIPQKKFDPYCKAEERIMNPKENTPEWVIYNIYAAALKGDSEENFEKFYSFFASTQRRSFVYEQHWPRILKHVSKYVAGPDDPSFSICQRVPLGEERLKIFVKCNDPKKTHPPIILTIEDGRWVVDIFTP